MDWVTILVHGVIGSIGATIAIAVYEMLSSR